MRHEKDLALARSLVKGDEAQFNAFFDDFFPRLYRFALTRLESDEQAAKDVVQATLMNAVRAMSSYRGEAAMFTWLCQICRNEINGHFRRLARSVPVVPQDDDAIRPILESLETADADSPEAGYQGLQLRRLIQEVLDFLPSNYGQALEWKYIEGVSVTEIAQRLNVTELAAQSMLARARNAFRDALKKLSPQLFSEGGYLNV
ncbi:MAG: RNA polymerase sigma factor [Pseudomonadales bacterium]